MITKRQREVLDFIQFYSKKKGYAPSLQEISKHFKLSSVSTAHFHVSKLKKEGYLERLKNRARAISVPEKESLIKIPLLGTIAAGEPIEAIQQNEFISVPKTKLPKSGAVYALRVSGNSMIDENIRDGDVVLVKQQQTAENGQRVVALIDNYEATLKKIYKEHNQIRLQPANSAYEPIIIRRDRDIAIQGLVIEVVQNEEEVQVSKIKTSITKRNKSLPLNKIILGDAVAELKKLPDESCDVVVVDPPYNIGKDFGNNLDKRELSEYVSWCKEWINECIRVMKPTGTMFVYGFSEILAHLSVEIPINKRWLIWHYTNKNMASCNFWQRSHEAIICAWKNKPIFNKDEVREPYTEGFLNGAAGKIRTGKSIGRLSRNGTDTIYNAHPNGALPRDVIKIPALAGGAGMVERWFLCKTCNNVYDPRELKKHEKHEIIKHPTQKPLEISRKLILSAMPKKDGIVLVPFVGTGSECVAAKELGQSYVGFEINPDYVRIAEKFLSSVKFIPKLL
jgi:site-specific DNA-methyltransferase (adenine-specific)